MKFIDLFAGIGGFRRGMELAGHECVGFCEWDKYASASYRSMHTITEEQREYLATLDLKKRQKEILKDEYLNGEWYADDIRTVHAGTIPKADCWGFGAPCQDFSVAGKRAGLDGDRSSLVRQVFRILGEMPEEDRPEWLVYENVKGMLSSNRGLDFLAILLELDEGGYDCEWEIFNSKDYGVPQNRERVYTVGHLRSKGSTKVFPIEGTDGEDRVQVNIIGHRNGYRRNTQVFAPDGITEALDTAAGGGRGHHVALEILNKDYRHMHEAVHDIGGCASTLLARDYKDAQRVMIPLGCIDPQGRLDKEVEPAEIAPTLRAQSHGNQPEVVIPVLTPDRAEKRQNGRRFKEDGDPSFTLTAQDRHGVAVGVASRSREHGMQLEVNGEDFSNALTSNMEHSMVGVQISGHAMSVNNGVASCLNANDQRKVFGANQERTMAALKIKEATKRGYSEGGVGDSVNLALPNSKTRRGRVGHQMANTLDTSCNQGVIVKLDEDVTVYAIWYPKYECYIAIRKLTPKECFRLQGWTDDYFEKAQFVNSDSQLYKQAGNGITVNVVYEIAKRLEKGEKRNE